MANPFMGEIKMVSFPFAPRNWAFANGQTLPVNQNQALFSLFGVTYGGNGQTTFNLPNLQGRSALFFNNTYPIGSTGGEAAHTLTTNEMPAHIHAASVSTVTDTRAPGAGVLPGGGGENFYASANSGTGTMAAGFVGNAGGNQSHNNLMPYQVINFIVALAGVYPTRN